MNIYADPSIWVCMDEGCNSNCHGDEWAENTDRKIDVLYPGHSSEWINRYEKNCQGIGKSKVKTYGKRRWPAFFKLERGETISAQIKSHAQAGKHPILLSDGSQDKSGMVKDMRNGRV